MYILEKLRLAGSRITNEKYVNISTKACTGCQFQSIPTKELHDEKSMLRKRREKVELKNVEIPGKEGPSLHHQAPKY